MRLLHTVPIALLAFTGGTAVRAAEGAAGPDQTICGTAAILAADPLGPGESGVWGVLNGTASFSDNNSPISQVTGLSPGDNVLQWTIIGDGLPETDQMIITVFAPTSTVAFAGPDSVLCLPVDTMHLLAAPPTPPAIGSWSSLGIALINGFTDPNSAAEFPSGGNVQLIWTVFNGTCGQISDTAVVTVQECVIGLEEQGTPTGTALLFDALSRILIVRNVPGSSQLDIVDQSGRIEMSMSFTSSPEERIPLNRLLPGTYVVRLSSQTGREVLRVVIDH